MAEISDDRFFQLPKQSGGYFGPLNSYEDSDADLPQVPCLYLQNVSLVTFGTGPLFAVVIRCSFVAHISTKQGQITVRL
jgi:hypothetical protein